MRRILIERETVDPRRRAYGFPWRHDAACYNFRPPRECVEADKIGGIERADEVETLVIGCDLSDYGFIGDMVNLRQLYVYAGDNLRSLDFVRNLIRLSQLYIAVSRVESLTPLADALRERKRLFDAETDANKRLSLMMEGICINSNRELDGRILKETGLYVSEIIVNGKKIAG